MSARSVVRTPFARILVAVAITTGLATLASATGPAVAQTPVNSISISVLAPAAIESDLDLRLLLNGVDVTDASCGPLAPFAAEDPSPTRDCTDIADGTYSVGVVGHPDVAVTVWECSEIVATPAPHTAIPISVDRFNEWYCRATTSRPGVLLDQFGSDPRDVSTLLFDSDGRDITSTCTDDEVRFDGKWCSGLEDGTYEVRPTPLPDGYRVSIGCAPFEDSLRVAAPETSIGSFTLDAERPLWQCGSPFVFAPFSFQLAWQGSFGRDTTWFENVSPVVTDQAGVDQSDACSIALGSSDEGFYVYDCLGLADGQYSVVVPNIPEGFDVDNSCTDVAVSENPVDEGAACDVLVTSDEVFDETIDPPQDDADDEGVPVDQLPETGASPGVLALVGAALVLAGVALTRIGGRRPASPLAG